MAVARLDLWSHLQAKALRLEAACVLLASTTAGLALLTGWLVTRPASIYYIPASVGPGLLAPGEVPDALARDFAQQLVLLLASLVWSALLSFGVALLAGIVCGRLKRGRPPGTLIHALHRLEILPIPGVLRAQPRHYAPW